MTRAEAKALTQKHDVLNDIRALMLDMPPTGGLCNECIIRDRLQVLHDKLAVHLREDKWQEFTLNRYGRLITE